jgi:hypothetical protein
MKDFLLALGALALLLYGWGECLNWRLDCADIPREERD